MVKVDGKIVDWAVMKDDPSKLLENPDKPEKPLPRPSALSGRTYKVKSPHSDHALYITINDHEGIPFEIFLNSKDAQHHQWMVALTRVISAVFRKGGEINFLIDELRSVFDPNGGHFRKGKYIPSLVAEIGEVLEEHLSTSGLFVKDDSLAVAARAMVEAKKNASIQSSISQQLCLKCGELAVVKMDGCLTCTACGESKCS